MSSKRDDSATDVDATPARPALRRITAVVSIAILLGVVAWVVALRMQPAEDLASPSPSAATATIAPIAPMLATADDIRAAAVRVGHAIYWAGAQPGAAIELTVGSAGEVFVRYLPIGEAVGSKTPFLTVATYPDAAAYSNIVSAAAATGAVSVKYAGGAFAVASSKAATSVNFAFDGAPIQIEVFSPNPGEAWALIEAGTIAQVL